MMTATKCAKTLQAAQRGWVILEDGYEMTQSSEIIEEKLSWLKSGSVPLILVQEGYQSGACLLLDATGNRLHIERPFDWPGAGSTVRVVFKGSTKLWHHFYTKIFNDNGGILQGTPPNALYKLQRRNHFRVRVPLDSRASFRYSGVTYQGLAIHDLSAGGAKLFSRQKLRLPDHTQVTDLRMEVYAGPDNFRRFDLICRKGRLVRSVLDKRREGLVLAVQFLPDVDEEEALIRYVRQRELDLLRRERS